MLLSLFDNLIAPKPQPVKQVDETSFQREFEIEVNGENVPVRIMFEQRFNNRVTVNKNGILIRISERQAKEEQRKKGTTPGDLDRLLSTHPLPADRISYVNKELSRMSPKPDPTSGLYTDEYQKIKAKVPSR